MSTTSRVIFRVIGGALLLGLALAEGACAKKAAGVEGLRKELATAGLQVTGFAPVDGARYAAYRCEAGRIEGLDALACEYGDLAAAALGRQKAEAWVGNAVTGLAMDRDKLVLAVADRGRVDPNGRTISRVGRVFRGTR